MPDPQVPHGPKRGHENAYKIIFWATVVLLLCCLGAWLVFKFAGGSAPKPVAPAHPTSMLVMPAPERPAVRVG